MWGGHCPLYFLFTVYNLNLHLLPEAGSYLSSVSMAVGLGESYGVLGDQAASRQWWEVGCQFRELREFDPVMAVYWQGKALLGLGDGRWEM